MLEMLVAHYAAGNKARFASMLGVRPQTINTWLSRNTFDSELIYSKCEGVSGDWLLSGEGSMLKADSHERSLESLCRSLLLLDARRSEIMGELSDMLK